MTVSHRPFQTWAAAICSFNDFEIQKDNWGNQLTSTCICIQVVQPYHKLKTFLRFKNYFCHVFRFIAFLFCQCFYFDPGGVRTIAINVSVCLFVYLSVCLVDSSDFGFLLGEISSPNCEIPCLGRRWTTVQNLTPLALSSAEKSVNVQTNKHTNINGKRYIHILFIEMCG